MITLLERNNELAIIQALYNEKLVNLLLDTGSKTTMIKESLVHNKDQYIGDIEKAFLQIGIQNEHQIYIRYLWEESNKLEIYQMIRLPFGLSCSPAILMQAIQTLISE